MASLRELIVKISADSSDFQRGIAAAQKQAVAMSQKFEAAGAVLTRSLTLPIGALGALSLRSAAQFDSLERGLRAVSKTAGDAEAQMARLRKVAELPGLGFREAIQGSINLQAAGLSAQTAERALKAFGNALATVGKGRAELDGVVLALSQIQSKGKISAEEINQLAERLPQIRVAIRDAFGTADTEAIQKLGITSQQFIEKVIQQFEKLPAVTGGIGNSFENLRDRAEQSLAKIGTALVPAANAALKALDPIIDAAGRAADQFTRLPQPAQTAALALLGIAAATGPILTLVSNLQQLQTVLLGITNMLRNPVILPFLLGAGAVAVTLNQLKQLEERYKALEGAAAQSGAAVEKSFSDIDFSTGFRNSSTLDELKVKATQNAQAFREAGESLGDFGAKVDRTALAAGLLAKNTGIAATSTKELAAAAKVASVNDLVREEGISRVQRWNRSVADAIVNVREQFATLPASLSIDVTNIPTDTLQGLDKYTRNAISSALEYSGALTVITAQLEQVGRVTARIETINQSNANRNTALGNEERLKSIGVTATTAQTREIERVRKVVEETERAYDDQKATIDDVIAAREKLAEIEGRGVGKQQVEQTASAWKALGRQVSTIVTDLSRGIADIITEGANVGEVFRGIAQEIGKSMLRFAIEQGVNALMKALGQLIAKVFDVGAAFNGVFGGISAGAKAAGSAAQIAGGAASTAGTVASTAAGIAGNSIAGVVGAVSGVATAIFSGLQYLNSRRMEQDIGRIEVSNREIAADLSNLRADEWSRFNQSFLRQGEILTAVQGIYEGLSAIDFSRMSAVGAGGSMVVNNYITGVRDEESVANAITRKLRARSARF